MKGVLLLVILLAGCATPAPRMPGEPVGWATRQAALTTMDHIRIEGRVAVNDGERSWQGRLFWVSDRNRYEARVLAPFGQTVAEMHGADSGLELRLPDRPPYRDDAALHLFSEQIGWHAPLTALHWWLIGLPDPAAASHDPLWDDEGRLVRIAQHGWTVRFTRYGVHGGRTLPARIEVASGERMLKLAIDRWLEP